MTDYQLHRLAGPFAPLWRRYMVVALKRCVQIVEADGPKSWAWSRVTCPPAARAERRGAYWTPWTMSLQVK